MRIKKYAAAFLAATTVLGSLAACGEKPADVVADPTSGVVDPGETKEPEPETPVVPAGPVVITNDTPYFNESRYIGLNASTKLPIFSSTH